MEFRRLPLRALRLCVKQLRPSVLIRVQSVANESSDFCPNPYLPPRFLVFLLLVFLLSTAFFLGDAAGDFGAAFFLLKTLSQFFENPGLGLDRTMGPDMNKGLLLEQSNRRTNPATKSPL